MGLKFLIGAVAAFCLTATATAKEKPLQFHLRAYECKAMEFPELNSMKRQELESAFCSAAQGWKDAYDDAEKLKSDGSSYDLRSALTAQYLTKMNACLEFKGKSGDLLARKFGGRPDCSRLPAPARDAGKTTAPSQ